MGIRKRVKQLIKSAAWHLLFPGCYRLFRKRDGLLPGYTVFFEEYGSHISDNSRMIRSRMRGMDGFRTENICLGRNEKNMPAFFRACLGAVRKIARAEYIFMEDSSELISALPLGPETKVIQLWHACGAFKKFGYSLTGKRFGADEEELERFPRHRNFTYVTVSAPEVIWAYAEAFHMEERKDAIVPAGIARTDLFFDEKRMAAACRKRSDIVGNGCSRFVLYAPTFRGNASGAAAPVLPDFEKLRHALGNEWGFLIKQHPFVRLRPQIPEEQKDYVFDLTDSMPIHDLMMASDLCITDYSSIVFEYALLDRPMIFFAPDLDDYDDWRGFYYPYEEMTPGPVCRTNEEMVEWIRNSGCHFDRQKIREFREKFMSACDGHATERILEMTIGKKHA